MNVRVWCPHPPAIMGGRVVGGSVSRLEIGGRQVSPSTPLPQKVSLDQVEWMSRPAPGPRLAPRLTRLVTGSKGKTYLVTQEPNGRITCTCPGFTYRRDCKHARKPF